MTLKRQRKTAKSTPWLPKAYRSKPTMLFDRVAIYMALQPGKYFTSAHLCRAVSDAWPPVDKFCLRLEAAGLVLMKAAYLERGKDRYGLGNDPLVKGLATPEYLHELPDNEIVIVYAASPRLVESVKSVAFLKMIKRKQARSTVPVNERIIRALAALHPKSITVSDLKKETAVSESRPDLARRLEFLAAADWVVLHREVPSWASGDDEAYRYYFASTWKVKLSAGGWLRVQRARHDGVELKMLKPKKKPKKKETVAV